MDNGVKQKIMKNGEIKSREEKKREESKEESELNSQEVWAVDLVPVAVMTRI
jgi:hypothetical protein